MPKSLSFVVFLSVSFLQLLFFLYIRDSKFQLPLLTPACYLCFVMLRYHPPCKFCFRVVLKLIFKHKSCVVSFLFSLQRTYIFTFLLSSRLFIHPYELMSKVCHLCMEQQRLGDPQADKVCTTKQKKNPFFVVNVLGLVVIIVYSVLVCLSHINR